jgi:hypothetical protein
MVAAEVTFRSPLFSSRSAGVRVEEGSAGGAELLPLGVARRFHPGLVCRVPVLLELIDAEAVKDPLSVLLLDRVVQLVEVADLEVTALDVPEVREQVVADVLLVAVAGCARQRLLRRDPSKEEVSALLVRQHIGACRGGVVQLPRLLLGVVQLREAATANTCALVVIAGFGLEVEVPGAVVLPEFRTRQPDVPDLRGTLGIEDRIALLVPERSLALASPVVARLEHPPPAGLLLGSQPVLCVVRVWRDLSSILLGLSDTVVKSFSVGAGETGDQRHDCS